ncbi:MAG TPA: DUF3576 domain-containing protein [Stellaceae bacterium]|jgi:hypothetical protein|nr:DUF3576 domain-containing protein [Stellaceae bacterium]
MPAPYYRLLAAIVASISLLAAGCSATKTAQQDATVAQLSQPEQQQASAGPEGEMDTESTIWTLLGIAKKPRAQIGPVTGTGVSPVLWQATLDTLNFVEVESADPIAGIAVTKWYAPKNKPDERFRITAFIKARALRSDSLVVSVERQTRGPGGQWQEGTIAADVANNLENDILERARQIHIARIREEQQ